jgi:WD40 repeat protein
MSSSPPEMKKLSAIAPRQKMAGHTDVINQILRLPGGQRIMSCSLDGSIRIWDLESGTQVGEAWKDEECGGLPAIALSPDGKKVVTGSDDGAVRLWDIETGKVIKKFTGHTDRVLSVSWRPDGGRVVSGSDDKTFRVWDVENGKTIFILTPIMPRKEDLSMWPVCEYSPNGDMIATGGNNNGLKVWDANSGILLKTLQIGTVVCLGWTSESDVLIASELGIGQIRKFDVPTWTEIAVLEHKFTQDEPINIVSGIALSPNGRILASVSQGKTAQLWNFTNNQPIGPLLHHSNSVRCAAFSADGKLLFTGCWLSDHRVQDEETHIYIWDIFAIVREAGLEDLLSDNDDTTKQPILDADVTRRRDPPIKDARRIPRGFFDNAREFDTSRSAASHTQHDRPILSTLGRLTSLWRRPDSREEIERKTISRLHPLSWAQHFVSGVLGKRNEADVELREIPTAEVPYTSGKPRNYHARKKMSPTSLSRPPNPRTTQQLSIVAQNIPSSSQTIITTSEALPAVATTTLATETTSQRNITIVQAGCWIRFLLWIGCASIEYAGDQT